MFVSSESAVQTIKFSKTGQMLMNITNTNNKRSQQDYESDCPFDENFNSPPFFN